MLKIVRAAKPARSYEEAFHEGMKGAIREGDTVWDIGANVGLYTKIFAEWVGPTGRVVAIEPLPSGQEQIRLATKGIADIGDVQLGPWAVSDAECTAQFEVTAPEEGEVTRTSRLTTAGEHTQAATVDTIDVQVRTVDTIVSSGDAPMPTVIKIDVEGFEDEVVKGAPAVFRAPECREVFIEMHFTRFDERGIGDAPGRIMGALKDAGVRVKWLDPSHIHATKA